MLKLRHQIVLLVLSGISLFAHAQVAVSTAGTVVMLPADGEVRRDNDQATATLMLEEQDKDKSVAASRLNQKMKQGTEIVRRADPQAKLTTRGYYTYPVYPDEPAKPNGKARVPVGWRVGQYLEVVTTNLTTLPKTVAAAQGILALNGLRFSLSSAAAKKLDEERIAVAYKTLSERIFAVARAMGRNPADAVLESVDLDSARDGNMALGSVAEPARMRRAMAEQSPVEEPSFEPGETTLHMQMIGKVRFK